MVHNNWLCYLHFIHCALPNLAFVCKERNIQIFLLFLVLYCNLKLLFLIFLDWIPCCVAYSLSIFQDIWIRGCHSAKLFRGNQCV